MMADTGERQPLLSPGNEEDNNQNIVSLGSRNSDNPKEWSNRYKWFCVWLLCGFGAVVTYTCIGVVPVAGDIVKELKGHKDGSAAVLFVTIWEIGEATGPIFLAPLSERYGRFLVYNVANCCFILGILVTALSPSMELLIFARLVTGCAVAANVLNPAIIGDLFPSNARGSPMSAVMLAPLIGGALGPTVSGPLAEATGWRQIMWLCLGIAIVFEILFFFLFKETYYPVITGRQSTQDGSDVSEEDDNSIQKDETRLTLLQSMLRPFKIFGSSLMLQFLALWSGVMFSFFYVNSTSLPEILDVIYGFSPSKRGLSYLAWSLGSAISILTCNRTMDKIYNTLEERRGEFYPEARLPLAIGGAFLSPLSTALYGWTAQLHAPVFLFLSTVTLLCISLVFSIVPTMTFITDAFGKYSASAMTAVLTIRSLIGALLPLLVPNLADKIGYGWTFVVLAGIALVLAPLPCLVMRYGPKWRQKSQYMVES